MWRLLIFSALVALTWAHEEQAAQAGPFGGILASRVGQGDPRLAVTALRIFALEKKIDVIKTKIEEAKKLDPATFVNELDARIEKKEGNGCSDRRFQCGGHDRECISDLLVCDGHKDCANGADESSDVCDTQPFKAGNTYIGSTHWRSCLATKDRLTRITIIGSKKVKFFTSRVKIVAQIAIDHEEGADHHIETETYVAHGHYNFGTHRLVLFPDDGDLAHIGVVCDFDRGDHVRADCTFGVEISKRPCATALLHLQ